MYPTLCCSTCLAQLATSVFVYNTMNIAVSLGSMPALHSVDLINTHLQKIKVKESSFFFSRFFILFVHQRFFLVSARRAFVLVPCPALRERCHRPSSTPQKSTVAVCVVVECKLAGRRGLKSSDTDAF